MRRKLAGFGLFVSFAALMIALAFGIEACRKRLRPVDLVVFGADAPAKVRVDGGPAVTVSPGGHVRLPLRRGAAATVEIETEGKVMRHSLVPSSGSIFVVKAVEMQCFAELDVKSFYGAGTTNLANGSVRFRRGRSGAKVVRRHREERFDIGATTGSYALPLLAFSREELPEQVSRDEHPRLIVAVACAILDASDAVLLDEALGPGVDPD